ncbi:M-phase phosphoprotein 8-like isoform X1 [Anguilla anguilla]|uniref:M-phase phosphoprotein 8-like isoform X1 n=1 Tax=Anguilla anguilla TaxID=7936 RepID=UPI0015ABC64D|nr:M-phase phosphoprotein 8-like isoform X1 [Anguilla anguilla]
MEQTTAGTERSEPGDSEQDEEEDVYEVEKIIDMRTEEGEVLYRVRWKNYTSDEDTWEPEAHLEDCREVLLAYKRKLAESKPKKDTGVVEEVQVEVTAREPPPQKLPMKSDLFDADSESENEKPAASPPKKKKKKKKSSKEVIRDPSPDPSRREKKKKKDKKKRWKQEKVLPAPESDGSESEEEKPQSLTPTPPHSQKRPIESEEEEESPVTPKKQKRDKPREGEKRKKEGGDGRKKDHQKELVSSDEEEEKEEEESASMEGDLSEVPQFDDGSERSPTPAPSSKPTAERQQGEVAETSGANQKKSKAAIKLQGIKELIQVKRKKKSPPPSPALAPPPQKESAQQKLKKLLSGKSVSDKSHGRPARGGEKAEPALLSSDSSDAPATGSVRRKSKGKEAPSSPSLSSSSSSGAVARDEEARPDLGTTAAAPASGLSARGKEPTSSRAEKEQPASTNLFEKFLLHCEAKDRVPRRQAVHTTSENRADQNRTATPKTTGKPEKKAKPPKESAAPKLEQDRTEKAKRDTKTPETSRPKQSLSAPEMKQSERRESSDSLTDRQGRADSQGAQGKIGVDTDNEKREESLEKWEEPPEKREEPPEPREEPLEKREDSRERRQEVREKREELREKREEPRERKQDAREKREEPRERRQEARDKREEPREKKEEPRERRGKPEEVHGRLWERKTTDVASPERRRRREDSEQRLFGACNDDQDPQDRTADRAQASLNLGVDLKLDWMTLEDFQKHLNGEDEILSAATISPSELRDAVKAGDYLAVKLALGSTEDYNLDQEDSSGMSLAMLAAAGGQDDILRLLIKKGVKVNWRQKNGTTALMHAAEKNFLTTVAILLEAGAHVNAQTLGGETALMKACKRGNGDVVRLLLEYGGDCNILSKHQNNALNFAKLSNNMAVYDYVKEHMNTLWSVAEETIRAYFETRLALLEPVFPLACHRLCEGPDFSLDFNYKPPPHCPAEGLSSPLSQQRQSHGLNTDTTGNDTAGSGILLFVFHANFLSEITARLCGPCSVHAVVLNDKFQLPIFLDSHFIYSFSPVQGLNKLFIRLADSPTAKVKLLICAYRVQLQ